MNGFNKGYGNRQRPNVNANSSAKRQEDSTLNELADKAGSALGTSPDEVKKAARSGDLQAIMSKLSPSQSEQLKKILSDDEAAKKLLSSPQAQAIMRGLGMKGTGKNE